MSRREARPRYTHSWRVAGDAAGVRLDKFLADDARLASRSRAVLAVRRGKVFVNDAETADGARLLSAGDEVAVWIDRPGSSRGPTAGRKGDLDVVFEDDQLIVVNKPAGLLSVPLERKESAPSLYDQIEHHWRSRGKRRPLVVHRIDRDTSGLVAFATNPRALAALKQQFLRQEPDRVYLAVVYGRPDPPDGIWRDRLVWDRRALVQKETHPRDPHGSEAVASYRTVEAFRDTSLLEVRLRTGRRNQIRLQARLRGHVLVGEQRYTFGPDVLRPIAFGRQALHAWRLALRHPVDDRRLEFEAPLPKDFDELLTRLRAAAADPTAVARRSPSQQGGAITDERFAPPRGRRTGNRYRTQSRR
jgi:23S rRNA pseudouridine1911/1915/1917 synthase